MLKVPTSVKSIVQILEVWTFKVNCSRTKVDRPKSEPVQISAFHCSILIKDLILIKSVHIFYLINGSGMMPLINFKLDYLLRVQNFAKKSQSFIILHYRV